MEKPDKKIIAFISNARRHFFVAEKINSAFPLAGIVIEKKYSPSTRISKQVKHGLFGTIKKLYEKLLAIKMDRRYEKTEKEFFGQARRVPLCPIVRVGDINSERTLDFIKKIRPDFIVVSGTSLVKKNIIGSIPPNSIINLHTGLAPYYRGGPSTFWCLYNEEPEFIGATVHFLNEGIDSGEIIISRQMNEIEPKDNEATIDNKVIKLGARLMIDAIKKIIRGNAAYVRQWEKGKVYASKDFTLEKRLELERKMKSGLMRALSERLRSKTSKVVKTID